jgi:hypothetical protein
VISKVFAMISANSYDEAVTSRRRRTISVLLAATVGLIVATVGLGRVPAFADEEAIGVRIQTMSPTVLSQGATVSLTGTVTNSGSELWTSAHVYLVIAKTPLVTRSQVDQALSTSDAYAGDRVIEVGYFAEIGNLEPGATVPFQVSVPYNLLGVSGAEGIYPTGVQVVATAPDGSRSPHAIARATTFLPTSQVSSVGAPTGLVWTFQPVSANTASAAAYRQLLATIGSAGVMRRQFALASTSPSDSTTILIDPLLLDQLQALAGDGTLPSGLTLSDAQRQLAAAFYADLVALTKRDTTWVTDYAQPDLTAFAAHTHEGDQLRAAVGKATAAALEAHQLNARIAQDPGGVGLSSEVLSANRVADEPFLVPRSSLPQWEERMGSTLNFTAASGATQIVVDHALPDTSGAQTTATLRQRVLAEAALAAMSRSTDSSSRADALVFVSPQWDPGADYVPSDMSSVGHSSAFESPTSAESLLTSTGSESYGGSVTSSSDGSVLSKDQLDAAVNLDDRTALFGQLIKANTTQTAALYANVADSVSLQWRADPATALSLTQKRTAALNKKLRSGVTVTGPSSVSLASASGSFPLTIANDTGQTVHVGVHFKLSNPAVGIESVPTMSVAPGERRTVDVAVDMQNQATTTVSAQLVTAKGNSVGQTTEFNVRSTQIAMVVWVAMAVAVVSVLLTQIRHFRKKRRQPAADADDGPIDG